MSHIKCQAFISIRLLLIACVCVSFKVNAQDSAISVRLLHDDNVGFAPSTEDAVSKDLIRLSGERKITKRLGLYSDLSLMGRVDFNEYRNYAEDHFDIALSAAYTRKIGLGFKAPRLTVSLLAESKNYEVDLRDVFVANFSLGISKPIHDRIDLGFMLSAVVHDAEKDEVDSNPAKPQTSQNAFDRDFITAEISATTYLDSNWSMPLSLVLIDGDLVSISEPDPEVLALATAANDYSNVLPNSIAYRSEGRANSISIGLNRSLTDHSSLSFLYTAQSGETGTDTKYSRDLLSLEYTIHW